MRLWQLKMSNNAPMSASIFNNMIAQAEELAETLIVNPQRHDRLGYFLSGWRDGLRLKEAEANKKSLRRSGQ